MTSRDVTALTDVAKFKTEADGSFKRQISTFRDTISVGGKYEPAPGLCLSNLPWYIADQTFYRSLCFVCFVCLPYVFSLPKSDDNLSHLFPPAWAHRTIIVRHLKGLTEILRERSTSQI